ncbi:MAG: ethanolamine ammonia-lyase reactivating factor EutA [Clostridia bacterium]|nr:ethanolamine ammonia-lyase reactivating factor EutA [Clostridia bacterium]
MAEILSVGIDIGTSTTQVIFSKISVDNTASYFSAPRIAIVGKEILYKSAVHFTPLKSLTALDGDGVRAIVAEEFRNAGCRPEDVDTGAVIITGESARKENAALVTEKLSAFAGEFVVSTAGPDLESVVAGKGSGAFAYSSENECSVVNLDIGGGTTNICLFDNGETRGKCCFDIGGRLIKLGADGRIAYIAPAAKRVADSIGVSLAVGDPAEERTLSRITDKMAELLAAAVDRATPEPLLERVRTEKSTRMPKVPQSAKLCFSGGVAECFYRPEPADPFRYGDIGVLLARSLKKHPAFSGSDVIPAQETIRATVVGAGTYTTSLSGSTIDYSPGVFPVKNVPALTLTAEEQAQCLADGGAALAGTVRWFREQSDSELLILALPGLKDPTYGEIRALAHAVAAATEHTLPKDVPVLAVVEEDIAKALGIALKPLLNGRRYAVIDSVKVEAGDYVDIGRPLMDGLVVPVIVKTLLFG